MYSYKWNKKTGGYTLTTQTGKYVASEIRPVYAQELKLIGFDEYFKFDENETAPICWAKQNVYIYRGEEIAKLEKTQYGKPITPNYLVKPMRLKPVDIQSMLAEKANQELLTALLADTQKRLKEMYDQYVSACDIAYIGFSGGKDSVLLLDICHRTLPLSVPVVFSDTDMELPDTYAMWEEVQRRYPERMFLKARADQPALKNWEVFGPPSRTVRWCCSVHKSTPAILLLKESVGKNTLRAQAFLGVRNEESLSRAEYDDIGVGVKNASQVNSYPVLAWGCHELWLYTFAENLPINAAYIKGLPRVGCVLCPEASEKYAWFVNAIYPDAIKPYNDVIFKTIDKEFESEQDKIDYLATAGWQARKSGETLKAQLHKAPEKVCGKSVSWIIPKKMRPKTEEWLKSLGRVSVCSDGWDITYRNGTTLAERHLKISIEERENESFNLECQFEDNRELRSYVKYVRQCILKAEGCVGCRACEAECTSKALQFPNGEVSIDASMCVHCLNCHSADYGCWRFKSMYVSEAMSDALSTINKYTNFGMREDWVRVYLTERENFSQTMSLGTKMIPAARAWFRQALLMQEKSCEPTKLLDLAELKDTAYPPFWDALWFGLANYAAIVKWFVTVTDRNRAYTADELFTMMGSGIKDATKKGGISAFKDMLTKSRFAADPSPIVSLILKGKQIVTMTRVPHAVDDLALLYSLFVMARQAEQTSFSVSGLMVADFSAKYVSPIVAFAMSVADFKQQCQGLADRYGEFIHCNFTLGLDEIQIKTDQKSVDDVVDLMLNS